MLRPEPMREVTLLVPKNEERRAIETLAQAQLLHVREHTKDAQVQGIAIDIGQPSLDATELADALVKTRALLAATGILDDEMIAPEPGQRTLPERIARVRALAERVAEHERVITDAQARLTALRKRAEILETLPPVDGEVRALVTSRTIAGVLITNTDLPEVRAAVALENAIARIDAPSRTLLVVRKPDREGVTARLKGIGAAIPDLAPLADTRGTLDAVKRKTAAGIHATEREIATERAGIADVAKHAAFLRATQTTLALELLKSQAPLRFGETKRVALIRGWVPASRSDELITQLTASGVRHVVDIAPAQDAPTLLRNPRPARGFESLLTMYSLPRYGEIDPTSVMAITFPVFFGFMLGDIGYGALVLAIAFLIGRRPHMRSFAEILGISAISAILFGAVFGEVFGLEAIGSFHLPALLHRAEDPMTLGMISLAFGVVHINMGLLFGLITEVREHGVLHGFLRKGGWFFVQAGVACLLLGTSWLWWSLTLGIGIIMLAWGEGVVGLVELPTIITHTLSYLRLAAIGLSGVFLAAVTNTVGGEMLMAGGWSIIGGLLILLIGHAVALALGLFGSFLHSLRLHYAEFFMKFYEGGGRPYVAFGTPESAGVSQ